MDTFSSEVVRLDGRGDTYLMEGAPVNLNRNSAYPAVKFVTLLHFKIRLRLNGLGSTLDGPLTVTANEMSGKAKEECK
jgi:hypothetical protein